jgi:hypothetical protein
VLAAWHIPNVLWSIPLALDRHSEPIKPSLDALILYVFDDSGFEQLVFVILQAFGFGRLIVRFVKIWH